MPQSLAQVYLHLIFSTKDRRPLLSDPGLRQEMHAYMATILKDRDCPALLINGPADHVHILCRLSKSEQNGYGAFSVSASNVQSVQKYIAQQEEHHKKVSFQEELKAFLNKHGVPYDERYLWD